MANKINEKTGIGDRKYAVITEVSVIPKVANRRTNRFRRSKRVDTIDNTLVKNTQATLP